MAGKGKGGRGKGKGKSTSRSAKAGLQFPVGRVARYMRTMKVADRIGTTQDPLCSTLAFIQSNQTNNKENKRQSIRKM